MSVNEEPIVAGALTELMARLDAEVPKGLITFRLFKEVVFEAESLLPNEPPEEIRGRIQIARKQAHAAIQEWLQAWADYLHASSNPGE